MGYPSRVEDYVAMIELMKELQHGGEQGMKAIEEMEEGLQEIFEEWLAVPATVGGATKWGAFIGKGIWECAEAAEKEEKKKITLKEVKGFTKWITNIKSEEEKKIEAKEANVSGKADEDGGDDTGEEQSNDKDGDVTRMLEIANAFMSAVSAAMKQKGKE